MEKDSKEKDRYDKARDERQEHVDKIIGSSSKKKLIVAGPGTGKTYLFKEALKGKKNCLTLTFVNALVEELSLELCGLSPVKTLHSFARSELKRLIGDVKVFPKLSKVIEEDAKILLGKKIDFDYLFHNRDDENECIKFYKKRKDYYDKHYGYSDIIFAIVKYFEKKNDKISTYDQIVVDEFQDFNKLELSLIDLLSKKSPVLLTGDDDQALYDFKSASPKHIRERHSKANSDYTSFNLPFCSRCTRVIVDSVNDIIGAATSNACLTSRVPKPYRYFECEEKDNQSNQNSKVVYAQRFERQIPWFIEQRIREIARETKRKFTVLIISPTKLKSVSIANTFRGKGFENIEFVEKKGRNELIFLDGLRILLDNDKSNLGWRIVSKFLLNEKDFNSLLKKTNKDKTKNIYEIIAVNHKKEIGEMLKILRVVKKGGDIDKEKLDKVLKKIEVDPYEIAKNSLNKELISSSQRIDPGIKKIPIKTTTIQGSKGLAAEYVFITHFDDQYFIKDSDKKKISDRDICNFIVALTRAEAKVFLISSNTKKEPTFLKWINADRIEKSTS
ncbi:MAG: AAA family ATPase [Candidatus Omnitrophica bacterium]|nr:AAA family ATPase [Candidatus Omnitrophota bacterium]